jgi:hypothetical protein
MKNEISIPCGIIKLFDEILDYAMTVKNVTGYKCPDEPDFLSACRFIGKIKEAERCGERKSKNRKGFKKSNKND